jgi:mxaA protein
MMRAGLAILMLGALAQHTQAEVRSVSMIEPRAFGYFLGDTLERTVEIETGLEDEIVPASLPRVGPSNYWLELCGIEQRSERRGDTRIQTLKLTYQMFYAPIDPRKQTIPAAEIAIRGNAGTATATIPSFTLIMSPLREIFPEKSAEAAETVLRPDFPSALRRSGKTRTLALVAAAISLGLLALLARDLAWWPFHRRPARPFSRAAREIGRALAVGGSDGYRGALLAMHRAFDAAAGRRLLAADVDAFLRTHPEHSEIRATVDRFFRTSRAVFFGETQTDEPNTLPPSELKELAVSLARQERASR